MPSEEEGRVILCLRITLNMRIVFIGCFPNMAKQMDNVFKWDSIMSVTISSGIKEISETNYTEFVNYPST